MAAKVVSILLLTVCVSANDRQRMSMDFTWKFILGEYEFLTNCSNASFPINMMNKRCNGLTHSSSQTLEQCIDACCSDINCATYQWCTTNKTGGCKTPPECWIGSMDDCVDSQGWISMGRPTPAPYNPPIKPDYNDSSWRIVNIPHDFIVETGAFNPNNEASHGYLPKNISWYRKYFKLDTSFKGKSIWIDFDGVYRNSDLYLNGIFVGNHQSGYTSFRYYINQIPGLQYGDTENVIAMRVDPTQDEGWWYEGGGIYRHTWLNVANQLHIKPWGVYAGSNVTNVINNKLGDATLDVQTNITYNATSGSDMIFSLQTEIVEKSSGKIIAINTTSNLKLSAGNELFVSQKFNLKNVLLWGINNPEMYRIYSIISDSNNNIIDQVETKFGFRKTMFDPNKGLFLNGEFVKMNGFCNHQDFAGSGIATPERINRYRVEKIQELGGNAWRMSHNPPNPELLDFTDEYGMLVWDENRHFANNTQYLIDQSDMINRDKNHPSIVIWSLCNEGGCMEGDQNGGIVGEMFKSIIYKIDNVDTRPVSAAMNHDYGDALSPVLDIQGINYNEQDYDSYHKSMPNQPIVSSENHVGETARGEYISNQTAGHSSSYDNSSSAWIPVYQRPFVAGVFFWTAFDYKGEPKPYGMQIFHSNR